MPTPKTNDGDSPASDAGARRRLVIVESPAKARTIAGYLGPGYVVESSIGHIRDLPSNSAQIPADKKKEPWARLGVDVDRGFEPLYVVSPDKKQQVSKLKAALKDVDELLLATDEDREGEAIAWHLMEVLKPRVPVRRMVFHEITPQAIQEAVENPREINRALVDAQETRRILDRLYGYEVSPVLWKKVMPRLSAGRVQSVATRLLVERERARMRFRSAGYWDLEAQFETRADSADGGPRSFTASLVALDARRVATGRDFDETGTLTSDVVHLDAAAAGSLATRLSGAEFSVRSVEQRPYRRSPYAPFITSTLQQEASRKLRFSAQVTMRLAQRLYENGYITYMRTDSTTLSETALTAARDQARELYGADYVPDAPRTYERKVKNAQEAHEAIRPAGDRFRTPQQVRAEVGVDEFRLYELIWQRTVASQMKDATGQSMSVRVVGRAVASDGAPEQEAEFSATGKVITFPGFLRAYVEETDDEQAERDDRERRLPPLSERQPLDASGIEPQEHATNPPARFTEASLVKALEELGIGRPSTYASILGTIQDRGYVFKRGTALIPSFTAFAVVGLLEQHFARLVDYGFTAEMEDDLDEIAAGGRERVHWLTEFYFGSGDGEQGLRELVHHRLGEIDAREVNSIPIGVVPAQDGAGEVPVVVRVGRYGPYVQRGPDAEVSDRASVPEDLPPDELTVDKALSLLEKQSDERLLGQHPDTGEPIVVRGGRYGPYVTTQPLDGGSARTASLLQSMSIETVSLDDALRLLSLPRVLGTDPDNGEEITVQNGRYGPYVKRGTESRSLESEDQLFTLTHDQALALLAQPRTRGRRAAAGPLRELGRDPATDRPVVVKEGRFGPYVTDGETNASLRKGDSVEEITIERAGELLAERRARGPAAPRKRAPRKTAKKTAARKRKPADG